MKKNILILGANARNGMAAAGALLGEGYNIIGMEEISNSKVVQVIRKISKPVVFDKVIYVSRYNRDNIYEFILKLEEIIIKNKIDVILPTGTDYTLAVSEYKKRLSNLCAVPCENFEKMDYLHDKFNAMELCKSLGIPTPITLLIENQNTIERIKNKIQYPSILKSRKGAANDGVWLVHDAEELLNIYKENFAEDNSPNMNPLGFSKPILQEYIPGELHDVTSFSIKGESKAVLSQIRLMTLPLWGGGGIVNKTTDNFDMKKNAIKIIKQVEWDGILEFDFKIDSRDGVAKLLEINPKIWGSTWLTVKAGFNMPLYLVKNALGESFEVPNKYKVNLCARWPLLEMETWVEKPWSVKIFIKRVIRFFKLFRDTSVVTDTELLGWKAFYAYIFISISAKVYRSIIHFIKRLR